VTVSVWPHGLPFRQPTDSRPVGGSGREGRPAPYLSLLVCRPSAGERASVKQLARAPARPRCGGCSRPPCLSVRLVGRLDRLGRQWWSWAGGWAG